MCPRARKLCNSYLSARLNFFIQSQIISVNVLKNIRCDHRVIKRGVKICHLRFRCRRKLRSSRVLCSKPPLHHCGLFQNPNREFRLPRFFLAPSMLTGEMATFNKICSLAFSFCKSKIRFYISSNLFTLDQRKLSKSFRNSFILTKGLENSATK